MAGPADEVDRAGITAFGDLTSLRPARQLISGVRVAEGNRAMSMTVVVYKWRNGAGPIPQEVAELLEEAAHQVDPNAVAALLNPLLGLVHFDPAELLARVRQAVGRRTPWTPVDYRVHTAGGVNWVTMTGVPTGLPEACRALALNFYTV